MVKNKTERFSTQLSDIIVQGIQEKKGNEVVRLDLRGLSGSVTDYFVICHADSPAQLQAIAKSVEDEVYKQLKQHPWKKEGESQGEWILLDFVDVVVHVFRTDKRQHYGIEDLWGDADMKYYKKRLIPVDKVKDHSSRARRTVGSGQGMCIIGISA